ncbi:MAG: formylglycine-generating enzyme family protein [Chloroflexi bacterium]|nr:formylglycine-generating enzyme family protein [Chloroflexota bacterium]
MNLIKQVSVRVEGTSYIYRCVHRIKEGDCQMEHGPVPVEIKPLLADVFATTNEMYYQFLQESGYEPANPRNFLKHWQDGKYVEGEGNLPVVNVTQDDARAFAAHYGKRLPTEAEWQYLAAGDAHFKYPWGNKKDYSKCNVYSMKLCDVDQYPEGVSPFGLYNMCGNVWEFTDELNYDGDKHHYFITLRGGTSYNAPDYWHTECGAIPNDYHLKVHQLGDAMNRYETVGFRCVKEVE